MADKRPFRALDTFLTRCRKVPANVASLSFDPSTGAASVSFFKPEAEQPESEVEKPQEGDEPIDFRFALERFNDSPKPRRAQ